MDKKIGEFKMGEIKKIMGKNNNDFINIVNNCDKITVRFYSKKYENNDLYSVEMEYNKEDLKDIKSINLISEIVKEDYLN